MIFQTVGVRGRAFAAPVPAAMLIAIAIPGVIVLIKNGHVPVSIRAIIGDVVTMCKTMDRAVMILISQEIFGARLAAARLLFTAAIW